MSISNFLELEILDHVLRNSSYTPPTTVYMSLHTADPGETGASEATGGSYARQSIAFNAASAGACTNSGTVTFSGMPAGTFSHFALWDSLTTGNCLWVGSLGASKTTASGDAIQFAASSVTISLD